jgi:uncharacterized protein
MIETEPDSKAKEKDRRLGDAWSDWKGSSEPTELEIDEKIRTFLILAVGTILMVIAAVLFGWYLAKPRFEQLSPTLSRLIEWSAFILPTVFVFLIGVEMVLLLKFGKSLVPYLWAEKLLLSLLSKTVWLGVRFGVSRDRVGNSFIKVHNLMLKNHAAALKADTFLILLPRCLEKDARRQIIERANKRAAQVVTAAGGEEARKAIEQYRPSLILAIACERDLISGIKDVAKRIPVLAIPNKRPEGPCKNTRVHLKDLDEALSFIAEKTGKTPCSDGPVD